MNYLMGTDEIILPEDVDEVESIAESHDSDVDDLRDVDEFIGSAEMDGVDLTSEDKVKAEASKKAVLSMIETFMVEKKKEGLSTEEILAALAGAGNAEGVLNRDKVMEFVAVRKEKLKHMQREKKREMIIEEQIRGEEDYLNTVKERADSQLLDDDYELTDYSGLVDEETYNAPEFTRLKYTPVAWNPSQFREKGYTIRCVSESRRRPPLVVSLTLDENSKASHLRESLRAIGENLMVLQNAKTRFKNFHRDVWSDVVVCLIVDGRMEMDPDIGQWLEEFKMLQEGSMRYSVSDKNDEGEEVYRRTKLHLFERTILLNKEEKRKRHLFDTGKSLKSMTRNRVPFPPFQMILGIKEKKAGKLDSHWWLYDAICDMVRPEFVITLEAGVCPTKVSFLNILTEMSTDVKIGAVSTNLTVKNAYSNPFNFIRIGQQFEFQTVDLVERCYQAAFGLVLDMPEEFAAFRYEAVRGAPLDMYFVPLEKDMGDLSPFQGNVYHAQQRVLANEVFLKKSNNYTVTHVMGATASVEVPGTLSGFLHKRRHAINASLLTHLHVVKTAFRLYTRASHDTIRRILIIPFYGMLLFFSFLSWVQLALFGLMVYYAVAQALPLGAVPFVPPVGFPLEAISVFLVVYVSGIIVQLIIAIGNKVQHVGALYNIIGLWYALVCGGATGILVLVYAFQSDLFQGFIIVLGVGGFLVTSLLNFQIHHTILSLPGYVFLFPIVVNMLCVYSFANLHDHNFGASTIGDEEIKGQDRRVRKMRSRMGLRYRKFKSEQIEFLALEQERLNYAAKMQRQEALYANFRTRILLMFVFTQVIIAAVCTYLLPTPWFFKGFAFLVAGLLSFKTVFAILFSLKTLFKRAIMALYKRTGFGLALLIYGDDIILTKKMDAEMNKLKNKDTIGQMDAVFGRGDTNIVFTREGNDNGQGVVRESKMPDRKFLGSSV